MNFFMSSICVAASFTLHGVMSQRLEDFSEFNTPGNQEPVTILRGTLSHGSYTPITINQSGVYRLAGGMSISNGSAITIAASNVTLDLDGNTITINPGGGCGIDIQKDTVVVTNGIITSDNPQGGVGIAVAADNCRLEHIDVSYTATGFLFTNAGSNLIKNCRALNASSAGFSFVSSGTNTVQHCQALDMSGTKNVYGFSVAGGESNIFDDCTVARVKTNSNASGDAVYGFYLSGQAQRNRVKSCTINTISAPNAGPASYGIKCVGAPGNQIFNNTVSFVTNNASDAIGVSADSSLNYVAKNYSCFNDKNYDAAIVEPIYITSQANARGVYNIDCANSKPDTVEIINSTIDVTVVPELWSIESKAEVISSKIDKFDADSCSELWSIESKSEVISSKIDRLSNDNQELWSIESKAEVISSKIDTIYPAVQQELWSIESKAEVISSKIDKFDADSCSELWSIESKSEVISSKIDRLSNDDQELWSIESKAEVISSKIDTIYPAVQPELWSIESKAEIISSKIDSFRNIEAQESWSIESKCEVISSKIDIPAPCSLTPITASGTTKTNKRTITGAVTLTDSGDYCLSADITNGDIVISGNNITLDLNGYTLYNGTNGIDITGSQVDVLNGTIQSPAQTGVRLRSAKCVLSSLDVVNTMTGYLLSGAIYNQLNNCRALNCARAGFSLENSSQYNVLSGCQAINTAASTTSVSGFAATGGTANSFESCSVENVVNSKTSLLADAQGFRLFNETNSQIVGCSVDNVISSTYEAYGIRLTTTVTQMPNGVTSGVNVTGNNIAWLKKSGTIRYMAVANTTANSISILKYDGVSLTQIASITTPTNARSVAWTTMGQNNYLAFTINANGAGNEAFVFQFVEPNQIFYVAATNVLVNNATSCAWLELGGARYLAVVADGGTRVRLLPFTGVGFGTASTAAGANSPTSVDCLENYVAVGGDGGANAFTIYSFNGAATLAPVLTAFSTGIVGTINTVRWLAANDGNYYLAIGTDNAAGNNVYVFKLTVGVLTGTTPAAVTVSLAAAFNHTGASVQGLSWLPVNKQFNYLALGGVSSGGITSRILIFNGSSLVSAFSSTSPAATVNSVAWFGPYLALAHNVSSTSNAQVINCDTACLNCLVDSNLVTNVRGGAQSGIGYAISEPNLFINNVAYNNDSNYYPQQNNQDNGNQGF